MSNFGIVTRILEGHGFSNVFFEEPKKLAATVRPIEILEALLEGVIRHKEINKLGLSSALYFDPTDGAIDLKSKRISRGLSRPRCTSQRARRRLTFSAHF